MTIILKTINGFNVKLNFKHQLIMNEINRNVKIFRSIIGNIKFINIKYQNKSLKNQDIMWEDYFLKVLRSTLSKDQQEYSKAQFLTHS